MSEITGIFKALQQGDKHASAELLPLLYDELRHLAAQKLSRERPGQTLQATALVHEAWLRLMGPSEQLWDGRGHFFAAAAEAMRRILIENARRKQRLKHGGNLERADIDGIELPSPMQSDELLALDEALIELEKSDSFGAQIVKMRFFVGLTQPQIAKELNVSLSTVERSWAFSRVWLFQKVRGTGEAGK